MPGSKSAEFIRYLALVAFIAVVAGLIHFVWHHFSQPSSASNYGTGTSLNDVEAKSKNQIQRELNQKDYQTYENTQAQVADNYLHNKDLTDAKRIMNDTFAAVPKDKLDYNAYSSMISIQKALKDNAKVKYYEQALINLLKSQGDTIGASQIQQDMDSLK